MFPYAIIQLQTNVRNEVYMEKIIELLNYLIVTNDLDENESSELVLEARDFIYFLLSNKACK